VTGTATKPSRIPSQIPLAWDAIDLVIRVRIAITRNIQTSIVPDLGMDAGPIGNSRPEARQATRSSCQEDFEPMVQCYHGSPLHLFHIVAMILTRVQDDDGTTIDAIEMVDEGDVEAERVVAMSTSLETQVRPVSLVVSLT